MSVYINSIHIPFKKINIQYRSVSFLIDKSEIDRVSSIIKGKSFGPHKNPTSSVIYSSTGTYTEGDSMFLGHKNKWFMVETPIHIIYEYVHMFPNLFELKFYGATKEVSHEDIRDFKINFLINN